jgi:hypothetical protein
MPGRECRADPNGSPETGPAGIPTGSPERTDEDCRYPGIAPSLFRVSPVTRNSVVTEVTTIPFRMLDRDYAPGSSSGESG